MDNFGKVRSNPTLEGTLREMGIDVRKPIIMGGQGSLLPPMPPSDPDSLQRNPFDRFYKYRAQEFWEHSEVTSNEVKDFVKCRHYLVKRNNDVECTLCHVGWQTGPTFTTQDGKLYNNGQELALGI